MRPTIELRDGSRVVGQPLEETLSLHAAALGDLKLPWASIGGLEYAAAAGDLQAVQRHLSGRFQLRNGPLP